MTDLRGTDRIEAELRDRLAAAEAQLAVMRKAIQDYLDGNYPHAERNRQCKHGIWSTDACENCIDEHFTAALAVKEPKRLERDEALAALAEAEDLLRKTVERRDEIRSALSVAEAQLAAMREALSAFAEHFGPLEDNIMLHPEARRCFALARAALAVKEPKR